MFDLKKETLKIFQVAVVFIGTIVGAGLASGKEITQFFTSFGYKSFIGIIFCGVFYVIIGSILSKISISNMLTLLTRYFDIIIGIVIPNINMIITIRL